MTQPTQRRPIRVSVVIPVYNAGSYLERSIGSMLAQTIPPDEMEIIAVDDGSTDESPRRLDVLAAEHPHLKVVHTPNSGWPGRPRNIGIDLAQGTYVQLLDQDDWMAQDALERLSAMGLEHASDIVIGKVASDFRPVPQMVFRQTKPMCTIWDTPLIYSLTPHKMFRAAFLREQGVRFAEGRRRLEDQLFMVAAYFAAQKVAILADQTYYFYEGRDDRRNAGSEAIVPDSYYGNLREVLETVVARTEPGEDRNRFLRRFWRVEMLGRLSEPSSLTYDDDYRGALFAAVRELALDMIPEAVDPELGPVLQARATLVRANRPDELAELAERMSKVQLQAVAESVEWRAGRMVLAIRLQFTLGHDRPLTVRRSDDRLLLDPTLTGDSIPSITVTEPLPWRAEVALRHRTTGEEWFLRQREAVIDLQPIEGDTSTLLPQLRVVASMDPLHIAGDGPLPHGDWRLMARLVGPGLDRRGPVADPTPQPETGKAEAARPALAARSALLGTPPHVFIPTRSELGALGVDVDRATTTLGLALRGQPMDAAAQEGSEILVPLPIHMRRGSSNVEVGAVLKRPGGTKTIAATLAVRDVAVERAVLCFGPVRARLPTGRYEVSALLDGEGGPAIPVATVMVDKRGHMRLLGGRRAGRLAATVYQARRFAKGAAWRLGRHLPAGIKQRIWRAYQAQDQSSERDRAG
jgi:glycosyltransferase involved in cell wall biosynthesis